MRKPYPSDLSDDQWALIEPLIPVNSTGRPREVEMREVLNAISYLNRSGCQWSMIPHDLPAKSTVYDHFEQWKADGTWQSILDSPGVTPRNGQNCTPRVAVSEEMTH